jgi:hypothetical protein
MMLGSSLRANGSRERAPDGRLREAIHLVAERKNGLLRRFAPRNDDCHFSPTLNGGSLPGGTDCSDIASIIATMT